MKGKKFMSAAALCLAALSGSAFAQDATFDVPLASSAYVKDYESFKLAAASETDMVPKKEIAAPAKQAEVDRWFTGAKVHQYLGLGTVVLAGLTAITAPGEGCEHNCTGPTPPRETNGTHAKLAKATVAMAAAAIATGLAFHWDDFHLADGFTDPDNLHVLLGVTGAALMAWAVNRSRNSTVPVSHAGIAELGALGMVAAIKITW